MMSDVSDDGLEPLQLIMQRGSYGGVAVGVVRGGGLVVVIGVLLSFGSTVGGSNIPDMMATGAASSNGVEKDEELKPGGATPHH